MINFIKKYFRCLFFIIILINIISCNSQKKFVGTIYCLIDNKPKKNIQITLLNKNYYTDNNGKTIVKLDKKKYPYCSIRIKYKYNLQLNEALLDTNINLIIQDPKKIEISIFTKIIYYELLLKKVELNKILINKLDSNLRGTNNYLKGTEEVQQSYLNENTNSAISDFKEPINNDKSNITKLLDRVNEISKLNNIYLEKLSLGELVNIDQLNSDIMQIDHTINNLIKRVKTLDHAVRTNIKINPDFDIQTDVFFEEGEYEINSLIVEEKDKISFYSMKIENLIHEYIKNYDSNQLRLHLKLVGYADGVPVSDSLSAKIRPICGSIELDPNLCLSQLRTRNLFTLLTMKYQRLDISCDCRGMGAILAKSRLPDPSIRKCTVSFSLAPISVFNK
jgi:hypothetical protein